MKVCDGPADTRLLWINNGEFAARRKKAPGWDFRSLGREGRHPPQRVALHGLLH
jgi:hypothetical protein